MFKVSKPSSIQLALLALVALPASALQAQLDPANLRAVPRFQTPVPYAGERNWHVTQNLGPTGARGWVLGEKNDTTASREILVKSIEPDSPAAGVIEPYDIIIGAAVPPAVPSTQWSSAPVVRDFDDDARLSLARAITWAESDEANGELKLRVVRDGKTLDLTLKLAVMGSYSPTAPYNCAKSDRIVKNAGAFVAQHMPANGYFDLPGAMNALLLYATGDDRYLDHVRRTAMRMSVNHTITDAGHETWRWGYQNLFLTEYYLATGDQRVLPTIQEYCRLLAAGQCNPGTWGHRAVPDFIPPGYGSMNQSGLICFLSMVLAQQAGVEVDAKALSNCINFYGSYAGLGGVPYGDHAPHADSTCNGKNGSAAVVFAMLDAQPASQWFARLCASANLGSFEGGHTGNFFNQTWSPLGASLAGAENYSRFWSRFNSYRDLARRHDGSFVTQPLPNKREGDLGTGNYVSQGPMWSTGGFALSYLAGNGKLAILGRRESVFAADPPQQLKAALELYAQKKFDECAAAAGQLAIVDDERLSRLAAQLQFAAQRNINSLQLTLADMTQALEAGDLYRLKWQLQAIGSIIDADDARLKPFFAAINDPANESILAVGAEFDRNVTGPQWAGFDGFRIYAPRAQVDASARHSLQKIASTGPEGYRKLAADYLELHPPIAISPDIRLIESRAAGVWRLAPTGPAPQGWMSETFDDSAWSTLSLPSDKLAQPGAHLLRCSFEMKDVPAIERLAIQYVLKGNMEVYLNGTRIFEGQAMAWWNQMNLPLRPATVELLKPGRNCLAVVLKPAEGDKTFELGLHAWSVK